MSFIDLFKQPKVIHKPYKCKHCYQRFRFKAHAVNHRRQTTNARCRDMGFSIEDHRINEHRPAARYQDNMNIPEEKWETVPVTDDGEVTLVEVKEEEKGNSQKPPSKLQSEMLVETKEEMKVSVEDTIIPFGNDVDEMEEKYKK